MEDIAGASVLITGGAGFVGSNLAEAFVALGARVRVLDNLSTGNLRNLGALNVELVEGDIRHLPTCLRATEGVAYVLHHAAIASVPESTRDPIGTSEINFTGTLNVLEASARAGVRRLVFASSASVYGQGLGEAISETLPLNPCSPYAAAKLAGESMCHAYSASLGLETVALRYFNIFGPRQDPRSHYSGVIAAFVDALRKGKPAILYGDGQQTRDFVYVGDVVQANLRALSSRDAVGRAVNIGRGEAVSIVELADTLAQLMGRPLELRREPDRVGDVRHSCADIGLARQLLGYEPRTSFAEGLDHTLRWFGTRGAA